MGTLQNKVKTIVFALLIPTVVWGQSQGEPQIDVTKIVGRENPFAGFQIKEEEVPVETPVVSTQVSEEHPDMVVETVVFRFLDAANVASVLTKMLTPYGAATANETTNSIMICDTAENMVKILKEIRKADQAPEQIVVEVVTLDVKLSNSTEIGVSWDLTSNNIPDVGYRQAFNEQRINSTIEDATTIGSATAFNSVGLGGDFSVVIGTVRHVLHMIQEKRDTEILASPRALVVSGQTATIKAVEEIPYEEVTDTAAGGSGALTSTRFKDVGVTLEITATAADGNDIILDVRVEQNVRTGQSASGVPVVDTRQANTSLFLKDGQTVVFAGLRRQEETSEVDKVPLLGDLPVVGNLFKNTRKLKSNSELVVLLSAHIDRGQDIPAVVSRRHQSLRDNSPLSGIHPRSVAGEGYTTDVGIQPPNPSK